MILKELLKDFHDTKNLKILKSKKTNIVYVKGKYASIIKKIPGIKENNIQIWESKYMGYWNTFMREPKKFFNNYGEHDYEEYVEDPLDLEMQAYEYDGHPDKFDDWKEANGY